jgi:hypothetical protein
MTHTCDSHKGEIRQLRGTVEITLIICGTLSRYKTSDYYEQFTDRDSDKGMTLNNQLYVIEPYNLL